MSILRMPVDLVGLPKEARDYLDRHAEWTFKPCPHCGKPTDAVWKVLTTDETGIVPLHAYATSDGPAQERIQGLFRATDGAHVFLYLKVNGVDYAWPKDIIGDAYDEATGI